MANQIAGSIAALHDSGLNASFATGKSSLKSQTARTVAWSGSPNFWYASVGYKAKIFKVGGTNFNFHYQETDGGVTTIRDSENTTFGITALQEFDAIGANIGLFYKHYELDGKNNTTGADRTFDDIDVFGLQTVFNF